MYCYFNNINTNDLNVILTNVQNKAPTPKYNYIEIPEASGSIDLTEWAGEVNYNNRDITLKFESLSQDVTIFENVVNTLHGRKFNIKLPNEVNYYYVGRVSVDAWNYNKSTATFTVVCNCDPFKYHNTKTTKTKSVSAATTITLNNDFMPVVPLVTVTGAVTITYNGVSTTLTDTSAIIDTLKLKQGANVVNLSGSGSVKFEYTEGRL